MIIYKVTNKITGQIYIGQTTWSIEKRWRYHCYPNSGCRYLNNAIMKHGAENFTVEQIDVACSKAELDQKEKYWIEYYDSIAPNGYNLKSGGNTPTYSEESRRRMSKNHADFSGANNPRFGTKLSEETKLKISFAHIGRPAHNRKLVKNIETGEVMFAQEAAKKYGVTNSTILKTCKGTQQTSAGYHWCYAKEGD